MSEQKNCKHDWIEAIIKPEFHQEEYICSKCGLIKKVPLEEALRERRGYNKKDSPPYTILELRKLHKEYDKEGFAKYSSYYGLHGSGHFTTENFLIWLQKREEAEPDIEDK